MVSERLPLFPLGVVLFPGMLLPLHIFEQRYRRLVRDQEGADPFFGVVLTKRGREVGERPEMHAVGTAASLVGSGRHPDGRYDLIVRGSRRFVVEGGDWEKGYFTGSIAWLGEADGTPTDERSLPALTERVERAFARFLDTLEEVAEAEIGREALPSEPEALAYAVCARMPLDNRIRQGLLEAPTTAERLQRLFDVLRQERDLLRQTGVAGGGLDHPGTRILPN